ncbi:MAG: GNAT family N-acetyltransferase [bacterium]
MKMDSETRPATAQDREQLYSLYCTVLRDHISAIWGWDDTWQRNDFDGHFSPQQITVLLVGNHPIGYMHVEERSGVTWLRMIAILPEHQKKGIGRRAMEDLIDKANHQAKDIGLQVFKINTNARRFYERLGFNIEEETSTHFVMRRKMSQPNTASPGTGCARP